MGYSIGIFYYEHYYSISIVSNNNNKSNRPNQKTQARQ